jgi:hypothetical protein
MNTSQIPLLKQAIVTVIGSRGSNTESRASVDIFHAVSLDFPIVFVILKNTSRTSKPFILYIITTELTTSQSICIVNNISLSLRSHLERFSADGPVKVRHEAC